VDCYSKKFTYNRRKATVRRGFSQGGMFMEFKGSYLGFTFNDIHSSSLGLVRTGDPFLQNTNTSNIKDKVTEISGRDGAVYFGSSLIKRVFPTSFAFMGVTEN
jgi:hypothetical protein